jgi:hypothetical protein
MGTVLPTRQHNSTTNHLKYCVQPGTATSRVLNAPQITISTQHEYKVRNRSLSTHFTRGVQYPIYCNKVSRVLLQYVQIILHPFTDRVSFVSFNPLKHSVLPILTLEGLCFTGKIRLRLYKPQDKQQLFPGAQIVFVMWMLFLWLEIEFLYDLSKFTASKGEIMYSELQCVNILHLKKSGSKFFRGERIA